MTNWLRLAAFVFVAIVVTSCEKNPGEPGGPYAMQKLAVGEFFEAKKAAQRIRYTGMPNENTISFSMTFRSAVNLYFPADTKVIRINGNTFLVREVYPTGVVLEWTE